jgi:hypothetical protein
MNNQSLILLAIGAFVALIVTVAAIDQYMLNQHPPTEVAGLLWRVENAFTGVSDLEATLQITDEEWPAESIKMKVQYVKGPPSALSMRYVPPLDATESPFVASVRDETFTVENDQLFHYIPSEGIIVSKRWPGVPLVAIGLSIFDLTQLRSDWLAGKTEITILQNISGFSTIPFAASLWIGDTFSHIPLGASTVFSDHAEQVANSYSLYLPFDPEAYESEYRLGVRLADSLGAGQDTSIPGSHVLEVRDATTKDLVRMLWIDRETYLIQKVVTFKNGQRSATLLVQLMTVDQGMTPADIITPRQVGVENVRG